tara:strand:- start:141 stop:1199 length:1059 start_codon:yes stop_codon:yes gene_type:complete
VHRLLITGGCGFIGSHTSYVLLNAGYSLIILDSFENSSIEPINKLKNLSNDFKSIIESKLKIYKGDIRDFSLVCKIFDDSKNEGEPIEGVIHFAGLKSVPNSFNNPIKYWDFNVGGTLNLIKVMNIYNCKTIVFSSSATIYGDKNSQPLKESSHINPSSPYGLTKVAVENILQSLSRSEKSKWRVANLRYFNPIGAHPSGLIGEDPINYGGNLFPKLSDVALGKEDHLIIFGNDWPTKDGTGIRDYIHVLDLAEGHQVALEYLINNEPHSINFNLGTGIGTSVLELINTFEMVNKTKIPFVFSSRRNGDIPISIADNSFAIKKLKWTPKRNLEDMCRDFWKWKIINPDGYKK